MWKKSEGEGRGLDKGQGKEKDSRDVGNYTVECPGGKSERQQIDYCYLKRESVPREARATGVARTKRKRIFVVELTQRILDQRWHALSSLARSKRKKMNN